MHDSFGHLAIFDTLPKDIEDIIFDTAYGMSRRELHTKCQMAKSTTYAMPVPYAWKRCYDEANHCFNFDEFLKNIDGPVINFEAVAETLNLLNWNALRSKQNSAANFVRTSTKTNLKYRLSKRSQRTNATHMIWHLLTTASRGDYCIAAFRNNNYKRFLYVPYFNRPLCAYFPIVHRWSAWELLQMGNATIIRRYLH